MFNSVVIGNNPHKCRNWWFQARVSMTYTAGKAEWLLQYFISISCDPGLRYHVSISDWHIIYNGTFFLWNLFYVIPWILWSPNIDILRRLHIWDMELQRAWLWWIVSMIFPISISEAWKVQLRRKLQFALILIIIQWISRRLYDIG